VILGSLQSLEPCILEFSLVFAPFDSIIGGLDWPLEGLNIYLDQTGLCTGRCTIRWSGGLDPKKEWWLGPKKRWWLGQMEVPTLGVVANGVVAWTQKKKGANRDQHSRDQRARSGGLWSGGLDPKRGANRDQHSRDQRGHWFFKGWGIVMIPHRPTSPTFRGSNTQSGGLWSGGLDSKRVPTITNIAVTNELGVVAYGVVDWTQRGVPTVTNIAVTNEDVGSSKGGNFDKASKDLDQLLESQTTDKSKKGLGYSAVTPPNPLVYNRPNKLDLSYSGLDEFKEPEFKGYGPENSKQESNVVCEKESDNSKENSDESLVEEQVSQDKSSFVESSPNVDKETVFPANKKVEFTKPENHEKPVKKSVRYAEMYRSQSPRGNQRNWNGQKSNQLGKDFGKPQHDDKGFVDSGCSRHMTGNIAYLSDFKQFDGGYVAFGGVMFEKEDNGVGSQYAMGTKVATVSNSYLLKHCLRGGISKEVRTPIYLSLVVPLTKVGDEAVHKELGDRMEMAATTASSLEAEQDSGSGPRCQDTILGDVNAQTRFEITSKESIDPPLSRGYTLGSGEDSMTLIGIDGILYTTFQLNAAKLKLMLLGLKLVLPVFVSAVKRMLMLPVQVSAFAETHNVVAFLEKPEESDGFAEIIDFLKASSVSYALTVNPVIYTSCIEQFWATAKVQTVNGVRQLQALVDKKRVIVMESSIKRDLYLDDAEGTDCLPTATIFEELARMGYEKPSQKLTFYKAFFSPQWKYFIHTITQCLSAKSTAWNEFSSSMASLIICLATNQKFNLSKYIFDAMVKHLDGGVKFLLISAYESKEKKEEGREETAKGSRKKMLGRKRAVKEQHEESSKKQKVEEEKESKEVDEV
ncbi:hypothetical protein Tco_1011404, partial [Tanacetum coccineum]